MINDLIVHFVWNGRKPTIRLHSLTLDKEYGGRRLVDIKHRDAALKVQWVQHLTYDDLMLKSVAYYDINARIFCTELNSRCSEWNCLLLVVDEWRLKSTLFSQFDLYIFHSSYHTFGKKRPTFSNSEANSWNSDGFAHRIMWCNLAIRASITTSVHLRNVSSPTPNSCENVRK